MFILYDGKKYVKESNKSGEYIGTDRMENAKRFTYQQALSCTRSKKHRRSWIRNCKIINDETDEVVNSNSAYYQGKSGIYTGEKMNFFDETVLGEITEEVDKIKKISGWDIDKLNEYEDKLKSWLSYYDSAESDIVHLLEKYELDHGGKKLPANKSAIIGYEISEIRKKHRSIKQCMRYVKVLKDSITYKTGICKVKNDLEQASYKEYKGRTDYYDRVKNIIY